MMDAMRLCRCGHSMVFHDVEDMEGNDPRCCVDGCDQRECGMDRSEAEALVAEHDRLTNERARLVLDGVDPGELVIPRFPRTPASPTGFVLPGGESAIRAAVERHEAELVRVRADLGAAWDDCRRVRADLLRATRDRDLARAESASARQELDALRTARDNLARTLGAACRRITELETT